jgi:hypothetical protein
VAADGVRGRLTAAEEELARVKQRLEAALKEIERRKSTEAKQGGYVSKCVVTVWQAEARIHSPVFVATDVAPSPAALAISRNNVVNVLNETRIRCYMDGAYADVCIYDNLCFKDHSDLVFLSDSRATGASVPKPMLLGGKMK